MWQFGKKVHNESHQVDDEMHCIVFRVKAGQNEPRKKQRQSKSSHLALSSNTLADVRPMCTPTILT